MSDKTVIPQPIKPPRKPGSQVAPNQKPLNRNAPTASTHSKVPLHQATAGKLYMVRDRDPGDGSEFKIWGALLAHPDAVALKETVSGQRLSTTVRVVEMTPAQITEYTAVDAPAPDVELAGGVDEGVAVPVPVTRERLIAMARSIIDDADGTETAEVLSAVLTRVALDIIEFLTQPVPAPQPHDAQLATIRAKVLAQAAPVAAQAQQRATARKTVMSAPPTPPPSPLTDKLVEDIADGDPEGDELDTGDISDLSAELGGGPSEADRTRAVADANAAHELLTARAMVAYRAATNAQQDTGPWPNWRDLGDFEHAAWRYFVANEGTPPELVKTARKVGHAGVVTDAQGRVVDAQG